MAIANDIAIDYINKIVSYSGGDNVAGSATGADSSTVLIDSAGDFGVTEDVIAGDIVTNTADGSTCIVISVDSTTQLTCTALRNGTDNLFQSTDAFTTHRIFSVNELYSYLQDTFDELAQMDEDVPMSAQTPTSYTMINGWYIQELLTQYLNGGAIQTSGYLNEIHTLTLDGTFTNFVAGDIGLYSQIQSLHNDYLDC